MAAPSPISIDCPSCDETIVCPISIEPGSTKRNILLTIDKAPIHEHIAKHAEDSED